MQMPKPMLKTTKKQNCSRRGDVSWDCLWILVLTLLMTRGTSQHPRGHQEYTKIKRDTKLRGKTSVYALKSYVKKWLYTKLFLCLLFIQAFLTVTTYFEDDNIISIRMFHSFFHGLSI